MTLDAQRHIDEVEGQGYSIAEGMLSDDFCEEIKDEIRRLEAAGRPALPANEFTGFKTLRYFDLLNEAEVWQRVATHPPMLEVLRGVLGNDLLLSTMGTAVIDPGETSQQIHCDDMLYRLKRPHKNIVCNTMWALDRFTEENGATRFLPGSNKLADYPEMLPDDPTGAKQDYATIQAVMPKGSVCFLVGTCYHSGSANVSDERRWALTINYCAGIMRQQENLMLAHTRERMSSFPKALQDILGFGGGLGHINAGDPRQVLEGVTPDPVPY